MSIKNKRVVLTGRFSYYPGRSGGRNTLGNRIEREGGVYEQKVNPSTDYLVQGENGGTYTVGSGGQKEKDARNMGVPVIGEIAFLNKFFPGVLNEFDRVAPVKNDDTAAETLAVAKKVIADAHNYKDSDMRGMFNL